mgnify:CR=1 FL=1
MSVVSSNRNNVWRPWRAGARSRVPAAVAGWIRDEGSLTQRLRARCGARFNVRVVAQGWVRPEWSERQVLGLRDFETAWVRVVVLGCGRAPWVVARTVMPRATLTGRLQRLLKLGNRPLGAVLFADKTMQREAFEFATIAGHDALLQRAGVRVTAKRVFGRRAVFRLDNKSLLVSEFFLPALLI